MTKDEALNIASQCRATASSPLAKNILIDGGSGLLIELLLDSARVIEALAQPVQQEPCDMGDICIGCSPRNADGSCPGAQPQQEPLGYIASMALNDLRCGIYRDVSVYGEEYEETVPIYTAPPQRKPPTA